jgi:hypothetical protein
VGKLGPIGSGGIPLEQTPTRFYRFTVLCHAS